MEMYLFIHSFWWKRTSTYVNLCPSTKQHLQHSDHYASGTLSVRIHGSGAFTFQQHCAEKAPGG